MDEVALVTGASRGLGRALLGRFAADGWAVVGVARGEADLARAVEEVRAAGGRAWGIAADVGDPAAAARIAGEAAALAGPPTLLVHNASTLGPVPLRPALDLRTEDVAEVLRVNLLGPFALTRAVAGAMAMRGRGTVVFVSSDAAVEAYPGWGAYGLSKAAADHLARTLAAELGPRGVRVVSVDPGEMDTRMHADAIPDADPGTLARPEDVAARIAVVARHADVAPNGRRLVARDVAVSVSRDVAASRAVTS